MQALKSIVIGMAVLIAAGMILLGYGLYRKASDPGFTFFDESPKPGTAVEAVSAPARAFGDIRISVPEGCELVGLTPEDGRLYLRIGGGAGCGRVVVVDAATGATLGTLRVEAAP